MARRFFYVSLGILALAIAYNLGARGAVAQGSTPVFAGVAIDSFGQIAVAITTDGDVYAQNADYAPACDGTWAPSCPTWGFVGNVIGGPVPVEGSSFGSVKGRYK